MRHLIDRVLELSDEKVLAVTKKSSDIAIGIYLPLLNISAEWLFVPADANILFVRRNKSTRYVEIFLSIIIDIKYKKKSQK